MSAAPSTGPTAWERIRAAARPERWDLVIVGLLVVAALALRLHLAWAETPGLLHAIGSDHDDWEGVFLGARHSWPPAWDFEWQRRYPLLPVLACALARATGSPMALSAQWISMGLGALVPAFTYAIGVRTVGRAAALGAAGWMVFQDGLTTYHVLTTAYSIIPTLYLALVLGLVMSSEGRWVGRALVALGAMLMSLVILQGIVLVLVTLAAALLAFAVAGWRQGGMLRRLWAALWPTLLGLGASLVVLARFERETETPILGALRLIVAEVNLTLLHNQHFGPPTGHKVFRLVNGTPRLEHLLATVWEQVWLPAWLLLLLVLAGVVLMLTRRDGQGRPGRLLMVALLGGSLYGFVANSEDFHVYQWFPGLILVACAGLTGWTRFLPWALPRRVLALALALGLVALQWFVLPRHRSLEAGWRYVRIGHFVQGTQAWATLAAHAVGPVSSSGTLLVDDPDIWAHRGLLLGKASIAELYRLPDRSADVAQLEEPLVLVSPRSQVEGRLAGRWDYSELLRFSAPRSYRLYLVRPEAPRAPDTPPESHGLPSASTATGSGKGPTEHELVEPGG